MQRILLRATFGAALLAAIDSNLLSKATQ